MSTTGRDTASARDRSCRHCWKHQNDPTVQRRYRAQLPADPVRVFQNHVARPPVGWTRELMVGRGSFTRVVPLVWLPLWPTTTSSLPRSSTAAEAARRSAGDLARQVPHRWTTSRSIPVRKAARCRSGSPWGGTPNSVIRAGTLGLMALAIIGGRRRLLTRSSSSTARPSSTAIMTEYATGDS